MSADIIPIPRVRVHGHCPDCLCYSLVRKSARLEGLALWDLQESCTMCGWSNMTQNVKVG